MAIIEVQGLTKHYGAVKALNGIGFQVQKGEIIGLLGPNGAGKTTTMKILTGYLQPTDGIARVAGHDVVADPLAAQAVIGYLPENAPLYLDMAVQEYLLMIAELRGISDDRIRPLLSEAVYSTGLTKHLTKPIGSLSKGYRQRVCLAQAILHKPQVLILDEPTNGLDPTQILEIRALIKRLAENATVIVSTHILSEVEATCHRAIIIMEGRIKADAKLDALTSSSAAVVGIDGQASGVKEALSAIKGVRSVEHDGKHWKVIGEKDLSLCPLIFDVAKEKNWRLAELRQETRTLESVFRELAQTGGVA
jgi:ABC-2 type transport system ATP-binding protein